MRKKNPGQKTAHDRQMAGGMREADGMPILKGAARGDAPRRANDRSGGADRLKVKTARRAASMRQANGHTIAGTKPPSGSKLGRTAIMRLRTAIMRLRTAIMRLRTAIMRLRTGSTPGLAVITRPPIGTMPERIGTMPERIGTIRPPIGTMPERIGTIRPPIGDTPGLAVIMRPRTVTTRGLAVITPPHTGTMPERIGTIWPRTVVTLGLAAIIRHHIVITPDRAGITRLRIGTIRPRTVITPDRIGTIRPRTDTTPVRIGTIRPRTDTTPVRTVIMQPRITTGPGRTDIIRHRTGSIRHRTGSTAVRATTAMLLMATITVRSDMHTGIMARRQCTPRALGVAAEATVNTAPIRVTTTMAVTATNKKGKGDRPRAEGTSGYLPLCLGRFIGMIEPRGQL